MTTSADILETATRYHRAGDLARAELLYRQVVQANSTRAAAWRLLGETCGALGRLAARRQAIAKLCDSNQPLRSLGQPRRGSGAGEQ